MSQVPPPCHINFVTFFLSQLRDPAHFDIFVMNFILFCLHSRAVCGITCIRKDSVTGAQIVLVHSKLILSEIGDGNWIMYSNIDTRNKVASWSVSEIDHCIIIRKLPNSIFYILPMFIHWWEIRTYLYTSFHPYGCPHKMWCTLVCTVYCDMHACLRPLLSNGPRSTVNSGNAC
jgi:hypothetical protein